jgi:hypothetical protein
VPRRRRRAQETALIPALRPVATRATEVLAPIGGPVPVREGPDGSDDVPMTSAPRTLPLSARCATIDGVDLILDAVELVDAFVVVHASLVESTLTRQLDQDYSAAVRSWEVRPAGKRGIWPPWPSEQFFRRAVPTLRDDRYTPYRVSSSQVGGSGTEWKAEWWFEPAAPPDARRFEIEVVVDGTVSSRHTVDRD